MNPYVIIPVDTAYLYKTAEQYIPPYEKLCCTLTERVLTKDTLLFLISEVTATELSSVRQVHGVFSFNKGRTLFHCIPERNEAVRAALVSFFRKRSIFCITGEVEGTSFVQQIIKEVSASREAEIRNCFFMERQRASEKIESCKIDSLQSQGLSIVRCSKKQLEFLMPLQIAYVAVEVLPSWRTVNAPVERYSLEQLVNAGRVFGITDGKQFVAKAHVNAESEHFVQIGGVYTVEQYRNKGLATALISYIAEMNEADGKESILFVRENNSAAISAYVHAGFVQSAKSRIVYYAE